MQRFVRCGPGWLAGSQGEQRHSARYYLRVLPLSKQPAMWATRSVLTSRSRLHSVYSVSLPRYVAVSCLDTACSLHPLLVFEHNDVLGFVGLLVEPHISLAMLSFPEGSLSPSWVDSKVENQRVAPHFVLLTHGTLTHGTPSVSTQHNLFCIYIFPSRCLSLVLSRTTAVHL